MAPIVGTTLQQVTLTLTLPLTRNDGSVSALTDIQSLTINRDPGTGAALLTNIPAPFPDGTVTFVDTSPATGSDIYTAFCTDTAGMQGDTSLPVSVQVVGTTLAPLSAPTLTAVAGVPAPAPNTTAAAVGSTASFNPFAKK